MEVEDAFGPAPRLGAPSAALYLEQSACVTALPFVRRDCRPAPRLPQCDSPDALCDGPEGSSSGRSALSLSCWQRHLLNKGRCLPWRAVVLA